MTHLRKMMLEELARRSEKLLSPSKYPERAPIAG